MEHYFRKLERSIKENWDNLALCNYRGEKFTFGEMATTIAKIHVFLEEIGIKKGDRIAISAKNSARWGIGFFASTTYGAVVVPILCDFPAESLNNLIDHSDAKVLLTDPDIWEKMDINKMPQLEAVISTANFNTLYGKNDSIAQAMASLNELFAKKYPMGFSRNDVKYPEGNDKELAIINYTSGTTSAPKGVMLRYECLSSNVEFGQGFLPSYPGDSIVSMLPMAHMYGMMYELIYPLCGGSTVYYLGKTPTPALLLGAMKEVKPYLMITVPLVMEKIFKSKIKPVVEKPAMKVLCAIPGVNKIIFKKIHDTLMEAFGGNIRSLIMGGAALNPDVEKWLKKIKLPFTVGYGMTEAAPLMAYEPWQTFVPQSCGKAVWNVEVRVDSEDPQHIVGELQARGTNIMSGYYKNPEATEAAFTEDGWMRTGDLGIIDANGMIFIKGRSKNMILSSNGQNIYPEELEAALNNAPYIVESVVVARDNNSKLVGLVYMDEDKMKSDGLDSEAIDSLLDSNLALVNKPLPAFCKLYKLERVDKPFEKTPKMSIKRFMYK